MAASKGDAARDRQDWPEAITNYGLALVLAPENLPIRIQLGHALKEAGRWSEAEAAYRLACTADPANSELRLHLGHVLKIQERRAEAIEAYADALDINPSLTFARNELISMGARDFLPREQYGQPAMSASLARISGLLDQNLQAIQEWITVSSYPVEAYHNFRSAFPVQPPPPAALGLSLAVHIDAIDVNPDLLRLSLNSLLDQRDSNWTAVIRASAKLREHPVASYACQDSRITFISDDAKEPWPTQRPDLMLLTEAGCMLDREAVGWLRYASERTGADVIYADHDYHTHDWRRGATYSRPALHAMPDIYDQTNTPDPPLSLLVRTNGARPPVVTFGDAAGSEWRRGVLVKALASGLSVTHLPRILSSKRISETAAMENAPSTLESTRRTGNDERILVIIPTRDQADILRPCLDSLKESLSNPHAVDVLVIDHRSTEADALNLLSERVLSGDIEVIRVDEPFNWGRFNNLAATRQNHDILVFANNDIEFLTQGWDDVVRSSLADEAVGIIGARLLYPDRTIQHAGMAMGINQGRPVHEGLGADMASGGPMNRWRRPRQASAVTGALMAVKRSIFEAVGGFDERLAVAYNDIDLCLRVREAGFRVLYEPQLEAIHHESKTRGYNVDDARVAWDDGELTDMYDKWGEAMLHEPGKNPHWVSLGSRTHDGYRDLSLNQVLDHLDRSAAANPWIIRQEAAKME
ncbi:glycosyltransferase [Brevundimonas diminuta]|uniref:glycosyltransferase n=1 Tax=Brevundimonas diminuta TaxID=293 RepID=UPI002097B161|nr:glycosyltransferase [Brevundimonas diminuta]MCO8019683.1 glycosyltransferase [Brevundimonas diminuta]MCO8022765.1 glycosyltransferase [Brevundimonas diminuta]